MRKYKSKKIGMTLVFALGVILSFAVLVLMVTGDVQKVVHFRGVLEEIVFTLFVGMLGIILLGSTISHILKQD
jgi:predicted membrane channel-forming protein YqfA (hemolysin III family)